MISKEYIKPSLVVFEFELDDVITASAQVITTTEESCSKSIVFDYGELIS